MIRPSVSKLRTTWGTGTTRIGVLTRPALKRELWTLWDTARLCADAPLPFGRFAALLGLDDVDVHQAFDAFIQQGRTKGDFKVMEEWQPA